MKFLLAFTLGLVFWPTFLEARPTKHEKDVKHLKDIIKRVYKYKWITKLYYDDDFKRRFGPKEAKIKAKIYRIMKYVKDFFMHKSLTTKLCIIVNGITHLNKSYGPAYYDSQLSPPWRYLSSKSIV